MITTNSDALPPAAGSRWLDEVELKTIADAAWATGTKNEDEIIKVLQWAESVRLGECLLGMVLDGSLNLSISPAGEVGFIAAEDQMEALPSGAPSEVSPVMIGFPALIKCPDCSGTGMTWTTQRRTRRPIAGATCSSCLGTGRTRDMNPEIIDPLNAPSEQPADTNLNRK